MAEYKTGMTAMIRKWVGLTAGITVQSLAGGGLCFSHYSPLLKSILQLSQVQLNNIGVAKDFGENVGLLSGLVVNLVPTWAVLLVGAVLGLLGYGTIYLVLAQRIAPLPYWQMALLLCMAANSSTWFNTAVLVTSMRNFPKSRGTVVGIIKGFIGLSGAIYTQIYVAILFKNSPNFVLFLCIAPAIVIVAVMYFIRPITSPTGDYDPEEEGGFFFTYIFCVALAVYLFVMTILENSISLSALAGKIVVALMCAFIASPLAVPLKFLFDKYFRGGRKGFRKSDPSREPLLKKPANSGDEEEARGPESEPELESEQEPEPEPEPHSPRRAPDPETAPQLRVRVAQPNMKMDKASAMCMYPSPDLESEDDQTIMLAVGEGAVRRRRKGPRRGEDFTLTQALVKADFWLLFFTFFCGVGTGNTALNNMGQLGQSLGYDSVTVFVSLYSICNFLGRLAGGTISEHYVRLSAMPRTAVMIVAQGLMIVGHLFFASGFQGSLLVGSILLGSSYGVHYTIMVPTASELFGLRNFGMIYNFITVGAPISSMLFSGIIAGYFYDLEASKESSGKSAVCLGTHCYRTTFLIMAGVCLAGLLANVLLTLRIGPVYQSLYENTGGNPRKGANQPQASGTQRATPAAPPRAVKSSRDNAASST